MRVDFRAARETQTSIPCHKCQAMVLAKRSCHEAHIYCPSCDKDYDLKEYIPDMDDSLEGFLEKLYFDRI